MMVNDTPPPKQHTARALPAGDARHERARTEEGKLLPSTLEHAGRATPAQQPAGAALAEAPPPASRRAPAQPTECAGAAGGGEVTTRSSAHERSLSPAGSPEEDAPGRRVLVVDDNADAAETVAELLRLEGHHVDTCADGASALEAVRQRMPEVVLLDLGLPGMDGYEVARRLGEEFGDRGPLLVALTGYGQPSDRLRTSAAGFRHHLVKPIDFDELAGVLACIAKAE